jgi:hypothetical protein
MMQTTTMSDEVIHVIGQRGTQRGKEYVVTFADGEPVEVRLVEPRHLLWRKGFNKVGVKAEYAIRAALRQMRRPP